MPLCGRRARRGLVGAAAVLSLLSLLSPRSDKWRATFEVFP